MCDKCPCNFGTKIKQELLDDVWGGNVMIDVYYVKCASWMGFGLAKCVKDFIFLGNKANLHWLNLKYFRVIGNIHDNPELLKQ